MIFSLGSAVRNAALAAGALVALAMSTEAATIVIDYGAWGRGSRIWILRLTSA